MDTLANRIKAFFGFKKNAVTTTTAFSAGVVATILQNSGHMGSEDGVGGGGGGNPRWGQFL